MNGLDTSFNLGKIYLEMFKNILKTVRFEVINSTEGGLLMHNNIPLVDSLKSFCVNAITKFNVFEPKKRKRRNKRR
jgi:hypothetical protein